MPGLKYDPLGDADDGTYEGFGVAGTGLVCEVCRAIVRKSPADARAHLDWHERVGG